MEYPLFLTLLILTCIPEMILAGEWKYPYFNKGFLIYSAKVALAGPNERLPEAEHLALRLSRGYVNAEIEFKKHSNTELLFRENLIYWKGLTIISSFRGVVRLDRDNKTIHVRGFLNWYVLFDMAAFVCLFYYRIYVWLVIIVFVLVICSYIYQFRRIKKELAAYYIGRP